MCETPQSHVASSRNRCYLTLLSLATALWRSGYAADCKSVYAGSIPAGASRENSLQKTSRNVEDHFHGTFGALVEDVVGVSTVRQRQRVADVALWFYAARLDQRNEFRPFLRN